MPYFSKVLIIDDDVATIRLMADILQNDHQIAVATDPEEGFRQAVKQQPDVILLDVVMPEFDGFSFCRKLKADDRTRKIPVIFVSALDAVEEQARGFELGAVDYIIKPIDAPVLKARVRTHARLYRQTIQLESLAATDPLTGLSNRRKFNEVFGREIERVNRNKLNLAMLVVDIDDFKSYNDHYGHGRGDDCLVQVARILRKTAGRGVDTVSRLGGEEFGVILPETDMEGAQLVARRIMNEFTSLQLEHVMAREHGYLTVSIGVGVIEQSTCCATKISERALMDVADAALYRAKEKGRNRLEIEFLT